MSASGNSSNLIPVVALYAVFHCHFIVLWFKRKKGAISYFTFETKMGSLIF